MLYVRTWCVHMLCVFACVCIFVFSATNVTTETIDREPRDNSKLIPIDAAPH